MRNRWRKNGAWIRNWAVAAVRPPRPPPRQPLPPPLLLQQVHMAAVRRRAAKVDGAGRRQARPVWRWPQVPLEVAEAQVKKYTDMVAAPAATRICAFLCSYLRARPPVCPLSAGCPRRSLPPCSGPSALSESPAAEAGRPRKPNPWLRPRLLY